MSKRYCIDHEGFTEGTHECNKCKSRNVFSAGINTRFPKHPKKRDFQEIFRVLVNTARRVSNINEVKVIHKYITNHRYRNSNLADYGIWGASKLSFKEQMDDVLKVRMEQNRKALENNKLKTGRYYYESINLPDDIYNLFYRMTDKFTRTRGFEVPAFGIILDNQPYDSTADTNFFKPKSVNIKKNYGGSYIFNTKKDAALAASYIAKAFLATKSADKYENHKFIVSANRMANKKYDIEVEFAQFFI